MIIKRGNPVLDHVKNVAWEFGNTVADYELGRTTCALFLSLRYHKLHPNYVYERLKELGKLYTLRLLLVLVDTGDFTKSLRELHRVSIVLNFTVVLAWSNEEAGRYLETFKAFEHKPADAIRVKAGTTSVEKLHAVLSNVRSVNKTNVLSLATQFNTVADILCAEEKDLLVVPGFGEHKAKNFVATMNACFNPSLYSANNN